MTGRGVVTFNASPRECRYAKMRAAGSVPRLNTACVVLGAGDMDDGGDGDDDGTGGDDEVGTGRLVALRTGNTVAATPLI